MKITSLKNYLLILSVLVCTVKSTALAQQSYLRTQDTVKTDTLKQDTLKSASLNTYLQSPARTPPDSRISSAAALAAAMLRDTSTYDSKTGIPINRLFKEEDLAQFSSGGFANIVALFEAINNELPESSKLQFITEPTGTVTTISNPLELKNLRVKMAANPASASANRPQWQENIYQAYLARDYGTRLDNTITITSATREIQEVPHLTLQTGEGTEVSIGSLLQTEQQKGTASAWQRAVSAFREMTYPNKDISSQTAHENYRRALFALIDLQQGDFNRHPETRSLLNSITTDLQLSAQSKVITALKGSTFFDENVPGNIGSVLVTEAGVINPREIAAAASGKALELFTLTALHYGERDAAKLFNRLLSGQGSEYAKSTGDFSPKRLSQLVNHGTEKLKSEGLTADEQTITMADLVLVAVAAPANPVIVQRNASLSLTEAGKAVAASYQTTITQTSKSIIQLNPRIILGSRYTTYKAANDPISYANEVVVTQKGLEFRLESDLYFGKPEKMLNSGLKPFLYPQFGIVFGSGKRMVGYDGGSIRGKSTLPAFKQNYINWGGHAGLNVGPVLVAIDAALLSTKAGADANQRFFDLSKAMTYYRYSFLTRILNLDLTKATAAHQYTLTFEAEFAGETNNEGTIDRTRTQNSSNQIGSSEWDIFYNRAHPNGVYNAAIANQMLEDGTVKASYPAANYAAVHLGITRGNLAFKITGGLYNRSAIEGYGSGKGEWLSNLFTNTFSGGNGFVAASLTINLGSGGVSKTSSTTSRRSVLNGVSSESTTVDRPSTQRIRTGLKSRALIMNRK